MASSYNKISTTNDISSDSSEEDDTSGVAADNQADAEDVVMQDADNEEGSMKFRPATEELYEENEPLIRRMGRFIDGLNTQDYGRLDRCMFIFNEIRRRGELQIFDHDADVIDLLQQYADTNR